VTAILLIKVFVPVAILMVLIFFVWKDLNSLSANRPVQLFYFSSLKGISNAQAIAFKKFNQARHSVRPKEGFADRSILQVLDRIRTSPVTTILFILIFAALGAWGAGALLSGATLKGALLGWGGFYFVNVVWNFFWSHMVAADRLQAVANDYRAGRLSDKEREEIDTLTSRIEREMGASGALGKAWYFLQAVLDKASIVSPAYRTLIDHYLDIIIFDRCRLKRNGTFNECFV